MILSGFRYATRRGITRVEHVFLRRITRVEHAFLRRITCLEHAFLGGITRVIVVKFLRRVIFSVGSLQQTHSRDRSHRTCIYLLQLSSYIVLNNINYPSGKPSIIITRPTCTHTDVFFSPRILANITSSHLALSPICLSANYQNQCSTS